MLTRAEAKRIIYKASKEDTSSPQECIHLLSLHSFIDKIYDEHEAQIDKAIIEAEDSGWMTYEDKQTCLEILYGLKDNA